VPVAVIVSRVPLTVDDDNADAKYVIVMRMLEPVLIQYFIDVIAVPMLMSIVPDDVTAVPTSVLPE
jgi:hypothetical protein